MRAGCPRDVVDHCRVVSRIAEELAGRVSISLDRDLARRGGLLHDIGRARTQGIGHAIAGAELARSFGISEALVSIIERHIGAGITAQEAKRLGLPEKDYLPLAPEEKIVSYADNLVMGIVPVSFERALKRFRRMLGPGHESVDLFIRQHEELQGWMR